MAGIASHAQTPAAAAPSPPPASAPAQSRPIPSPMPGFVSAFEIMRTVRSAGFVPLSPPLREGTIYVLRATDYRGIPMRVVLDARTGMIRNATPLVTSAGYGGAYGTMPGAYGSRPYASAPYGGPYGSPAGYAVSAPRRAPVEDGVATPPPQPAAVPAIGRAAAAVQPALPLPRPRPAVLASKISDATEKNGASRGASAHDNAGKVQSPAAARQSPAAANQTTAGAKSTPAAPSKASPVPPLTIAN